MSLSQITRETRLSLKIGSAVIGVLIIVSFMFNGIKFIQNTFFPKPPPPPTITFGKLTKISPNLFGTVPNSYQIETVEGTLPSITTDRIPVYKFKTTPPNILALSNAKQTVAKVGFFNPETKISNTLYSWTNSSGQILNYNILNGNFDLTSAYLSSPSALLSINSYQNTDIISSVSNFLGNQGLSEDLSDIDFSNATVKVDSTNPVSARVDLYQNAITVSQFVLTYSQTTNSIVYNTVPIYYPTPGKSSLYFQVVANQTGLVLAEGHFPHQIVDLTTSSTYPIKTPTEAFNELKQGNAIIANPAHDTTIEITDVNFGYLADPEQNYLYPMYIFLGKDNFIAYVIAVADSALTQ